MYIIHKYMNSHYTFLCSQCSVKCKINLDTNSLIAIVTSFKFVVWKTLALSIIFMFIVDLYSFLFVRLFSDLGGYSWFGCTLHLCCYILWTVTQSVYHY